MKQVDYYEFLQISPNAEPETIHRVYRFLGARYHPDNPQSGNAEAFSLLKTAYEVLSDPVRRADYDASCSRRGAEQPPLSDSIDFMDVIDGENNRRLAVMAILYSRRRTHPANPEISLADLEAKLGFPRDYLDFTTWYLKKKNLIAIGDNASFSLTVEGVDHVESERLHIPTLHKLLTNGSQPSAHGFSARNSGQPLSNGLGMHRSGNTTTPELPDHAIPDDRRLGAGDRRVYSAGSNDRRKVADPNPAVERRVSRSDRRSGKPDRRIKPS